MTVEETIRERDKIASQTNAEIAKTNAARSGPLADATARQQVVVQETQVTKLQADREERKLQTSIRKPADAQRAEAEAQKAADISAAGARAKKTELGAQANATAAAATAGATRATGEAEAAEPVAHVGSYLPAMQASLKIGRIPKPQEPPRAQGA